MVNDSCSISAKWPLELGLGVGLDLAGRATHSRRARVLRSVHQDSAYVKSTFNTTKTNNDDRVLESDEIWGAARTTTRAVHAAPAAMVAESTRSVETRARKRKRELDAQVGGAIPGWSCDVTVSLVE